MDLIGARKAATKLMVDPSFAASAPFITDKADWSIQINGAYNLLFPFIHTDFPVRLEVIKYVVQKLTSAFFDHNEGNKHFGVSSIRGIDFPIMPTQIKKDLMESIIIKNYTNKNGLTSFEIEAKGPMITPGDAVIAKAGYGV